MSIFFFLFYQKARLLPPGGALILTARLGLPKLSLYPPAINNKEFVKVMVLLLMTAIRSIYTYRTRAIITRGLYILNPLFEGQEHFLRVFFCKILDLCMVSFQEWL